MSQHPLVEVSDFLVQAKLNLMGLCEILDNARCKLFERVFGKENTAVQKNFQGCQSIVTGSNRGIGKAIAGELLQCGSDVILACRSVESGENAATELRKLAPHDGISEIGRVEVIEIDLASLESVKRFVNSVVRRKRPVDLIVCNAGIMTPPELQITKDGFELQFQANYLGHFVLVHELLRRLSSTYSKLNVQPRIVCLSSLTHHGARLNIFGSDFPRVHEYVPFREYANSKLCNILFVKELNRRMDGQHQPFPGGCAVAVHPGIVNTALARDYFISTVPSFLHPIITPFLHKYFFPLFLRTPKAAVETVMMACTAPATLVAGNYLSWHGRVATSSKESGDLELASHLWNISCHLSEISVD